MKNIKELFTYYKNLIRSNFLHLKGTITRIKSNLVNSNNVQKNTILKLALVSIFLFIFIVLCEFFSVLANKVQPEFQSQTIESHTSYYPPVFDKVKIQTPEMTKAEGFDLLDPLSSMASSINDAITSLLKQAIGLFDNYVAYTPNIANTDGNIQDASNQNLNIGVNKFYDLTIKIAWLLLPLLILVNGMMIVLEGDYKGRILLGESIKKFIIFVIGLIGLRFAFSIVISIINALNLLVIQILIGNGTTLSNAVLSSLGIDFGSGGLAFKDVSAFNTIAQAFLWVGIFFFVTMIMYQFIIRFFHLWLHLVLYPIELLFALLPGGGQMFKGYLEEIIRTLAAQPIFLIGLGMVLAVINSGTGSVTKIVLGVGALVFLNTIPSIVARFSGILWGIAGAAGAGLMTAATVGQAQLMKRSVVAGMTGEKSGSFRRHFGKSLGEALVGGSPMKKANSFNNAVATKSVQPSAQKSFLDLVKKADSKKAFENIGMKPLDSKTLNLPNSPKKLYSNNLNLSPIENISAKDGASLNKAFNSSNFSSFYTDKPATLPQIADISKFSASNPSTNTLMNEVVSSKQINANLGKTFDTSNPTHWNHVTDWYSKTSNLAPTQVQTIMKSPNGRHEILKTAANSGYFHAQKIQTVKVDEQFKNQAPITKYYKVKPLKQNDRNSTTKTK